MKALLCINTDLSSDPLHDRFAGNPHGPPDSQDGQLLRCYERVDSRSADAEQRGCLFNP